jgi:hypothetical protein
MKGNAFMVGIVTAARKVAPARIRVKVRTLVDTPASQPE